MRSAPVVALVPLLLLAGCGTETTGSEAAPVAPATSAVPVERPTTVPAAAGLVATRGLTTVIQDGAGAKLCIGQAVQQLGPPLCGGVPLVGWSWDDVDSSRVRETDGVRWGQFVVTGTFDGTALTPTEVVDTSDSSAAGSEVYRGLTTSCPEPDGGWAPIDPVRTTRATERAAIDVAQGLDDFAAVWGDQSFNPAIDDPGLDPLAREHAMSDPLQEVLNVQVTDDVARAETAVREVWGGALCVSLARFAAQELSDVREELRTLPGRPTNNVHDGLVVIEVPYDDGSWQAWVDQEYGDGAVVIRAVLVDVPGDVPAEAPA